MGNELSFLRLCGVVIAADAQPISRISARHSLMHPSLKGLANQGDARHCDEHALCLQRARCPAGTQAFSRTARADEFASCIPVVPKVHDGIRDSTLLMRSGRVCRRTERRRAGQEAFPKRAEEAGVESGPDFTRQVAEILESFQYLGNARGCRANEPVTDAAADRKCEGCKSGKLRERE